MVGTAFHWFATPTAVHEIARILKPEGSLGLIWNVFDTTVPWVAQVRAVLDPYRADNELSYNHDALCWREVFGVVPIFSPLIHVTQKYTHKGTCETVLKRVASSKAYGELSSKKQEEVNQTVSAIVQQHAHTDHSIDIPYRIEIYWAQKP